MRHIGTTVSIGSPCSPARFAHAQTTNGVPVCGNCIKEHADDGKEIIISIGSEECYVCEIGAACYLLLN